MHFFRKGIEIVPAVKRLFIHLEKILEMKKQQEVQGEFMQFSSACGEKIVDAALKTENELLSVAVAASRSGAKIIIANAQSREKELLIRIANAGKGNILFDLR